MTQRTALCVTPAGHLYYAWGEEIDGPTLVESQMYRLSAHGNIIAPPGVPLHFPEHEAIEKFGAPEECEAAKKGDPLPAFRGRPWQ